jgi:hypothetical protein
MPYITQVQRDALAKRPPASPGELNYAITKLISAYALSDYGQLSYTMINDVLGALEGAKLEFYRRVAVDYETAKLAAHGDVYT